MTPWREWGQKGSAGPLIAAVAAGVAAVVLVYVVMNGRVNTAREEAARAQASLAAARESAQAVQKQVGDLQDKVAALERKLGHAERKQERTERELEEGEPSTDLADGKYYGAIKAADDSPREIDVDIQQFLTGKAAEKAAKQDGQPPPENDYYIRNESKQLRTLPVAEGAEVEILKLGGGSPRHETISFTEFVRRYNAGGKENKHLHLNGFWLWIENGSIVKMEEQFVP